MRSNTLFKKGLLALFASTSLSATAVLAESGADIYNQQCIHCHVLDSSQPSVVGPHLENVMGRKGAAVDGYNYSPDLKAKAEAGLVWDEATMDAFLKAPREVLPATFMGYPGMPDEAQRKAVIEYLSSGDTSAAPAQEENPEVARIMALDADPDYGEYLAGECQTCHQADRSASSSVPPVAGLPRQYFIQAMLEYKGGTRENDVMKNMAQNVGDEELAALAAYFEQAK